MKAIIFDMDGVIIDSEPLHFEVDKELVKKWGGKLDYKTHEAFVGTTDYNMWSKFKKEFNLKPSVEEIIGLKKEMFTERIDEIKLMDNFMDLMLSLYNSGYLLAIASSNNRRVIDTIVKKFKLEKYMQFIISGEEVNKGKPNPEIFLTAAKKMNAPPSECLVIEDATNGVKAAKDAGMKCVGLKNINSGNQDLSDANLVVENLNELNLDIMKGLFE